MNRISISACEVPLPAWKRGARSFARKTLKILDHDNWDLSLLFCNDAFIRGLNHTWRNIDRPTDVLSFPLGEKIIEDGKERYVSGDIIISLDMLAENAVYFGLSEDEELRRLIVHGILHLAGYDHEKNGLSRKAVAASTMLSLQESIMQKLQKEKILD